MAGFRFAMAHLGCRSNQEEVDALRSQLLALGGEETPFPGPAEVTIVNTCAVTASAQAQSRQEIRKAARCPGQGWVIATGCAAQLDPQWLANLPGVGLVLGNREKVRLGDLLARWLDGGDLAEALRDARLQPALDVPPSANPGPAASPAVICWSEDPTPPAFLSRCGPVARVRSRVALKIQDGCSERCAYCIVSRLRGHPISRDAREVIGEVRRLAREGFAEVVLAGINLGLYGRAEGAASLADLLESLEAVDEIRRIRLSSLEPMTVTDELLDRMAASPRIAPHLHLAVQSGDDDLLRRMGRPYRAADIERLAAAIFARMPRAALGMDIVAGLPGETREAFERTLRLVERVGATYLHAFAYSERPGTAAADMKPVVPHPLRRERVHQLRALDDRLRSRYQETLEGRRCQVVIEWVDEERFEGLSGEYVRMRGHLPASGRSPRPGDWVEVISGAAIAPGTQDCRIVED